MHVCIVVPLFNEEESFPKLIQRLEGLQGNFPVDLRFVLVDDGSHDNTRKLITQKALNHQNYIGVILSRNYGHQYAVTAGMNYCDGAVATMIIDGDLQDPPELITGFYEKIQEGYDVVYAIRKNRKESFLKKLAYKEYYRLLKRVSVIDIPLDAGDFCMISQRVVRHINSMPERSRYLRGMRAWVGYKQFGYEYNRDKREDGASKYSLKKLIQLAYSGLFNFSEFPIKFMSNIGMTSIVGAAIYIGYAIIKKFFYNDTPEGFVAIIFAISFFSGLILLSLSLLGEYIIRIFNDVRNRPLYIVDELIQNKKIKKIG